MGDFENVLDATQEGAVDLQEDEDLENINADEELEDDVELDEGENDQDKNAEPDKKIQSKEENSAFAKIRRKAEEEAKKKVENELRTIEVEKKKVAEEKQKLQQLQREKEMYNQITPEAIQNVAYKYNVSEEYAKVLLEKEVDTQILKERESQIQRTALMDKQKSGLKDKPFFKELEYEIDNVVRDNPGVDINTAYHYLRSQKWEELQEKTKKETEKRTIANIQDRMKRKSDPSTSTVQGVGTSNLSKTTQEINAFLGVDSREVAKHKKENEHRFKIR